MTPDDEQRAQRANGLANCHSGTLAGVGGRVKRDGALTQAASFADSRSYVRPDGREVLFGADMTERRLEVYERDRGLCQGCSRRVDWEGFELDHIIKRGSHGVDRDDRAANLQVLGKWCGCHRGSKWAKHQ